MAVTLGTRAAVGGWLHSLRRPKTGAVSSRSALRLLFVATSDGEGGIERHSALLAEQLLRRGADITYACRPDGFLEWLCARKNVGTSPLTVRSSGDIRAALRLASVILDRRIQIVHVHSRRDFVVSVLAVAAARALRRGRGACPCLVLHAHLLKGFGSPPILAGRFFERGADAIVAVSEAVRAYLLDFHRFDPSLVSTLYNGLDVSAFALSDSAHQSLRQRTRRQWGLSEDALVIGMVGRLGAKGQETLLTLAPLLEAWFPNIRFLLVGPDGPPGVKERLQQRAAGSLAAPVVFAGASEDIPAMLAGMDVLAHLPLEEAFGLAVAEAMASGLPVVAASVGGCAEIVEDGVTGYLVAPGNETGVLLKLNALLKPDGTALRLKMGMAGRLRVETLFSLKAQVAALEMLYAQLLGGKASGL